MYYRYINTSIYYLLYKNINYGKTNIVHTNNHTEAFETKLKHLMYDETFYTRPENNMDLPLTLIIISYILCAEDIYLNKYI